MSSESEIIRAVRARYGPVINIDQAPEHLIDIIRRFGADDPDGGLPPGGVPTPPPPPGPSSMQEGPRIDDVMRAVLELTRKVTLLEERLGGRG